jgi:hypothetical protein
VGFTPEASPKFFFHASQRVVSRFESAHVLLKIAYRRVW